LLVVFWGGNIFELFGKILMILLGVDGGDLWLLDGFEVFEFLLFGVLCCSGDFGGHGLLFWWWGFG
jgi:hypothetical protein